MLNRTFPADDTSRWGEIRDPEIIRRKVDGVNWYEVWMDYALIEKYKSRPPAKRLVAQLEADSELQ